jgi:hypothetical protein
MHGAASCLFRFQAETAMQVEARPAFLAQACCVGWSRHCSKKNFQLEHSKGHGRSLAEDPNGANLLRHVFPKPAFPNSTLH